MLRIISFFILLIISQISFAEISYSTVPANSSSVYVYRTSYIDKFFTASTSAESCHLVYDYYVSLGGTNIFGGSTDTVCTFSSGSALSYVSKISTIVYSCSSGSFLSDATGNPSSTGQYCTTGNDSCTEYAGQSIQLYTQRLNPQFQACYGGCGVTTNAVGYSDAQLNLEYIRVTYQFTGTTVSCVEGADTIIPEADALAANEASELNAAKAACGAEGYTIDNLMTGPQSVVCNNLFSNLPSGALPTISSSTPTTVDSTGTNTTSSATTTATDGTTTTTTTDTTTTNSTASNGGSGGGTTAGTTTTTTTVRVTNPDGTVSETTSSTSSGSFPGTGANYEYADSKRNNWASRNFSTVINENVDKLKQTELFDSASGFFTVEFSGLAAPSNFDAAYSGGSLSASFDWATNLAPFQGYIRAVVLFLCSWFAFRRAIE